MDLDDIKQILTLIREHELAEFELERDGLKLRIRKAAADVPVVAAAVAPVVAAGPAPAPAPASGVAGSGSGPAPLDAADGGDLAVIKSPIVGTFYRAAEPGARSFAEVGDQVRKGQVICIIEAMKLMNEINAEIDGEVVKVYVENGQAVQYGERLFAIKPS
jgi:acetyl-CoA carboxylase biotin carboxyl carrier protein